MECSPSSRSLQWAAGAQLRNHQNPASQRASLASAVMCLPAVLLVFGIAAASAAKAPLDSFIPLCSKSDPKLNECVTKSAQLLLPAMAKGIRDYNMPPVEPLKLPFLSLSQSDKPVGLKLNISGTSHEGISGLKFLKSNIDLKKNHWELHLNFPRYSIIGTCDLGGRILLLPIVGHGPCNLTSLNMDAIITTDVAPYKNKNGKEYYKINNFRIKLTFHGGSFALEGLFGGNKELGSTMVRFLNENALDVFNEMKSTIQDVFSDVFGSLVARLFTAVPIEGVFKS